MHGGVAAALVALAGVAGAEPAAPAAITRVPFLFYLTAGPDKALCRDIIFGEQTRFIGAATAVAWTGSADSGGVGLRTAPLAWDKVERLRTDVRRNHTYALGLYSLLRRRHARCGRAEGGQ